MLPIPPERSQRRASGKRRLKKSFSTTNTKQFGKWRLTDGLVIANWNLMCLSLLRGSHHPVHTWVIVFVMQNYWKHWFGLTHNSLFSWCSTVYPLVLPCLVYFGFTWSPLDSYSCSKQIVTKVICPCYSRLSLLTLYCADCPKPPNLSYTQTVQNRPTLRTRRLSKTAQSFVHADCPKPPNPLYTQTVQNRPTLRTRRPFTQSFHVQCN